MWVGAAVHTPTLAFRRGPAATAAAPSTRRGTCGERALCTAQSVEMYSLLLVSLPSCSRCARLPPCDGGLSRPPGPFLRGGPRPGGGAAAASTRLSANKGLVFHPRPMRRSCAECGQVLRGRISTGDAQDTCVPGRTGTAQSRETGEGRTRVPTHRRLLL